MRTELLRCTFVMPDERSVEDYSAELLVEDVTVADAPAPVVLLSTFRQPICTV